MQHSTPHCSIPHHTAAHHTTLQHTTPHCTTPHHTPVHYIYGFLSYLQGRQLIHDPGTKAIGNHLFIAFHVVHLYVMHSLTTHCNTLLLPVMHCTVLHPPIMHFTALHIHILKCSAVYFLIMQSCMFPRNCGEVSGGNGTVNSPSMSTHCAHCAVMYTLQCTLYSVHYTVYIRQCTPNTLW